MSQLDLFASTSDRDPIGTAEVDERQRRIAERLPRALRLGTSSWSFPGWQGIVWRRPAGRSTLARHGLRAYSRHPLLRCVGLDRTFYRTLGVADYRRYAEQVPDDFRFLVKAPELCTSPRPRELRGRDNPRFLDPGWTRERVIEPWREGLGKKAGILLFQLPPLSLDRLGGARALLTRLEELFERLPSGPHYALEVRNRELVDTALYRALDALGVSPCLNVHPTVPALERQLEAAGPALDAERPIVIRWMLGHGRGYEAARDLYSPFDRLVEEDPGSRATIARLGRAASERRPVFVIANNKAEGSAPLTLVRLAETIAQSD